MSTTEEVVLTITAALIEQLQPTNEHNGKYYYAHDNKAHRIVWIFNAPLLELIGCLITVALTHQYGNQRLVLPEHRKRRHLFVRMIAEYNATSEQATIVDINYILARAPRDNAAGRKPSIPQAVPIKAHVPEHYREYLNQVGEGNISAGLRRVIDTVHDLFNATHENEYLAIVGEGDIEKGRRLMHELANRINNTGQVLTEREIKFMQPKTAGNNHHD